MRGWERGRGPGNKRDEALCGIEIAVAVKDNRKTRK